MAETPLMKQYKEIKENAKTVYCFLDWVIFMRCFLKMQR